MRKFWVDFKKFILRGNVLDLAVAILVGAAFKSVVDSFVNNLVMPIVGAIGGQKQFGDRVFTIHHSQFRYGQFLSDVVSFVIIAASVFLVVKTFETLQNLRKTTPEEEQPDLTVDQEYLKEIRDLLRDRNRA